VNKKTLNIAFSVFLVFGALFPEGEMNFTYK